MQHSYFTFIIARTVFVLHLIQIGRHMTFNEKKNVDKIETNIPYHLVTNFNFVIAMINSP